MKPPSEAEETSGKENLDPATLSPDKTKGCITEDDPKSTSSSTTDDDDLRLHLSDEDLVSDEHLGESTVGKDESTGLTSEDVESEASEARGTSGGEEATGRKRQSEGRSPDKETSKRMKPSLPSTSDDAEEDKTKEPLMKLSDIKGKSIYEFYSEKNFKGLTKHALQEMITVKFCDVLANRGDLGELRKRVNQLEDEARRINKLNNSLKKQLSDARHIIKKLVDDREVQNKTGKIANPLRVTRSVGLQVCTAGTFYMRKPQQRAVTGDKVIDLVSGEGGVGSGGGGEGPPAQQGGTTGPRVAAPAATPNPPSGGGHSKTTPGGSGHSAPVLVVETTVGSAARHQGPSQLGPPPAKRPSLPSSQLKPPAAALASPLLPPPPTPSPRTTTAHSAESARQTLLQQQGSNQPSAKKDNVGQQAKLVQPVTRQLLANTPGLQHFIIASPVKSPASSPTATVSNNVKVLAASIQKTPSDKPKPSERGKQPEKQSPASSPLKAMEVIDLTDKDDKIVQPPPSPRPKPASQTPSTSSQQQPSQSGKVQKKPEVVTIPDLAKPGKVICSVKDDTNSKLKSETSTSSPDGNVNLPPLPPAPKYAPNSAPPRPLLRICKSPAGIMLSWNFGNQKINSEIATFELFAFQERKDNTPKTWIKVGEVKALPLPMACTLTQFVDGQKYHFAVRAIDVHDRIGEFSSPGSIMLTVAD